MKFKLKAWHIYLIAIVVIPFLIAYVVIPSLIYSGYFTQPFEVTQTEVFFSGMGEVTLYGGILLAIYYGCKRLMIKKKKSDEPTFDNKKNKEDGPTT